MRCWMRLRRLNYPYTPSPRVGEGYRSLFVKQINEGWVRGIYQFSPLTQLRLIHSVHKSSQPSPTRGEGL
jgi:hypothetical protein